MTINQLIKKFQKIQDKHGKRLIVMINKEAINNCSHDHWTHGSINEVGVTTIAWEKDGDCYLANGEERMKTVCQIGEP